MHNKVILIAIAFLTMQTHSTLSNAEPHHHAQAPHVHGTSEIQLVINNDEIEILFESPASNIVGFEHLAKTVTEKEKVKKAKTILSNPKLLFDFDNANCKSKESKVNLQALLVSGHNHAHKNSHNEISALYRFQCRSIANLKSIDIKFFDHFPNISEISTQWITSNKQGMSTLKANTHQLVFGE